jgi:multimeric flavodoxin WrbA
MARLAVKEATRLGASAELLTLSDFTILECEGCMRCVFRNEPCHLADDVYLLLDKISEADAFFVISPTYVLTIPGALKLLIDRYLLMSSYYDRISGRSAISVGVAGLRGWEQLVLPLLNLFLLSLGFTVLDSFVAYGAGPGEALLDKSGVERLRSATRSLCTVSNDTGRSGESTIFTYCPVCFSRFFEKVDPGVFRCPICSAVGEEREAGLFFSEETLRQHRFSPVSMRAHLREWVLKTRHRFRERLPEISRTVKEMGL